jgi:hypothetical protein
MNRRISVYGDMIPAEVIASNQDDVRRLTGSQCAAGLVEAGA